MCDSPLRVAGGAGLRLPSIQGLLRYAVTPAQIARLSARLRFLQHPDDLFFFLGSRSKWRAPMELYCHSHFRPTNLNGETPVFPPQPLFWCPDFPKALI